LAIIGVKHRNYKCEKCNSVAHIIFEKKYYCASCELKIIKGQIPRNSKPVFKKRITKN
jgi:hypothetical protein